MAPRFTRLSGRGGRTLALAAAAVMMGGCVGEVAASTGNIRTGAETSAAGASTRATAVADAANPVRLRVPAIGVSARVIPLKLDRNGRLIPPKSFARVGWNKAGPEPGERGTAVIAGHVDSTSGPAVFFRLRNLRKGDRIHVDRADGSTVSFTVYRVARYPKNKIPDKEVYKPAAGAQLRLITCGGDFDRAHRSYRDNIVVFAR
ncbi:class F sortase [Thermopolyspora sp. NPDC052614]|uniref:class F sortase n=1 Tax=Thermopolyspora sp. NPDC052614 TaxID=3155682 RepID=UPI0034198F6B